MKTVIHCYSYPELNTVNHVQPVQVMSHCVMQTSIILACIRDNIEDGSSLIIIHWSSGSHKRSTNLANQYDIYFRNSIVCVVFSTRVPLPQTSLLHQHLATHDNRK